MPLSPLPQQRTRTAPDRLDPGEDCARRYMTTALPAFAPTVAGARPLGAAADAEPQERSAASVPGLVRFGRGAGALPILTMVGARHSMVAGRAPQNKVPMQALIWHVALLHEVPSTDEMFSAPWVHDCVMRLSVLDRKASAITFLANYEASNGIYGLHVPHDGTTLGDARLGKGAHIMTYGGAYWSELEGKAWGVETGLQYTAAGGGIEEVKRQLCHILADFGGLCVVVEPKPGEFHVVVPVKFRGALRTLPSDNATAATGVAPSIGETLDYHVDGHGCGTHKFALFGKKPSEAMCGSLGSVDHLHHLNILNKMAYLTREYGSTLRRDWERWKEQGELSTAFELQKEAVAGKWESTGDAMAQLTAEDAHFADWRRFATLKAHYLSAWNADLQHHFLLLQQMLSSAETLFDFYYNASYESEINSLFHWDKAASQVCPQSGAGFRLQDLPIKVLMIKHELLTKLPQSADSAAVRDAKIKAFAPRATVIVATSTRVGSLPAVGEITCTPSAAERLLEATRRHGDMAAQVWREQLEMYLTKPTLLFGIATDRIFGPFFAAVVLRKLKIVDKMPKVYPKPADAIKCGLFPEVIKGIMADILHYINTLGYTRLTKFWEDEGLGDSPAKLADWKALAMHDFPTREDDGPELLFAARQPTLANITPWFRGNIFSCPHSNRAREQFFSVASHLTNAQQGEGMKEALCMYSATLRQLRHDALSATLRKFVRKGAPEGTTKESALTVGTATSAAQDRLHGEHMLKLAAYYESLESGTLASTLADARQHVTNLATRRKAELDFVFEQQAEKRKRGRISMTRDAAAGARKENDVANHWATMTAAERSLAHANVVAAKKALGEINKAPKGALGPLAQRKPQMLKAQAELARARGVIPRFQHAGSGAVTRGEVVGVARAGKKPRF